MEDLKLEGPVRCAKALYDYQAGEYIVILFPSYSKIVSNEQFLGWVFFLKNCLPFDLSFINTVSWFW